MKKTILIILSLLVVVVLIQDFLNHKKRNTPLVPRPYVVMLSLDGFRWDYDTKTETPHFDFITQNGVRADGLQPAFPSKTFPNHYTIATGRYPGNHGLISNNFYAPGLGQYYNMRDRSKVENGKFYKAEPIWVTAEAQRLKTGSYFWVGSEAKIKGYRPTYWKKYDHFFPYQQRIDSVISWLEKPYGERPHLTMWYLDLADSKGHRYGPDSQEIVESVNYLDSLIGGFYNRLQQLEIKDSVNFIIVSDHGMGAIDTNKVIYLSDHLKKQWVDTIMGSNPFSLIDAAEDCADSVASTLNAVNGLSAWTKENLPQRFHYGQNERVSDVVAVADSGYTTTYKKARYKPSGGTHGYDNENRDMDGIFYAIGPSFKKGYNAGDLYNTDIYNLIARILKIKPATNDGKPERIMHVLSNEHP